MSKFYVSDLDGTLFRGDGTLSKASASVLRQLLADGLHFSVASARSVVSMRPMLASLPIRLPVIELNGAFVSDLETGRHCVVNSIDPELAKELYALVGRFGRSPFISAFNGASDCLYYSRVTNEGERHYVSNRLENNDHRLRRTHEVEGALRDQVVCLTVIGESGPVRDLEIEVRSRYGDLLEIHQFENQYSPGWFWLMIHDRRATKGQALQSLMDVCGLRDHQLVVFGDQINDITMFRIAAQAVAVANAHPEVKRHATHVIGPNQEDSVANFIHAQHIDRRT